MMNPLWARATRPFVLRGIRHFSLSQCSRAPSGSTTASADEIMHFNALAAEWWDPHGSSRLLHKMNESRLEFMHDVLRDGNELVDTDASQWLRGKRVLDVGCGGGILSESLARLGARVRGIDASPEAVKVAEAHRQSDVGLSDDKLSYEVLLPENVKEQYDVVTAMEILEHVSDPHYFLTNLTRLVRPGGRIFFSTVSRTLLAQLLTITLAEHVLGIVPPGTHQFRKFVRPEELIQWFEEHGPGRVDRIRGVWFNPLIDSWVLLKEPSPLGELCNYYASVKC